MAILHNRHHQPEFPLQVFSYLFMILLVLIDPLGGVFGPEIVQYDPDSSLSERITVL